MTCNLMEFGDLLNVSELAEYLGVSTRTIYRLSEAGELPVVHVGHRLYFPRNKLVERFGVEVANA